MQCKYCGNYLSNSAKFCEKCGTIVSVGQLNAAQRPAAPVNKPVQPEPVYRPVPQPVQQYEVQPPVQQSVQPAYPMPAKKSHNDPEMSSRQGSIFTKGLLSLIFASVGAISFLSGIAYANTLAVLRDPEVLFVFMSFAVIFGVMGIIFGAIALGKANSYESDMGETYGRATVGRHLGRAGFIVGIIFTAITTIYFVYLIIAINTINSWARALF